MNSIYYFWFLLIVSFRMSLCLKCGDVVENEVVTRNMTRCQFISNTTLIQCDMYASGNVDVKNILSSYAELRITVIFSFVDHATEVKNDELIIWCLSFHKFDIEIVNAHPENAQLYELNRDATYIFNTIAEFHMKATLPLAQAQHDAYAVLLTNCSLTERPVSEKCINNVQYVTILLKERYDDYINITQMKEEFIYRRQGTIEYFQLLAIKIIADLKVFSSFENSTIEVANLTKNVLNAVFEKANIKFLPKLTHLYISQCGLKNIADGNFLNMPELQVLDLSRNNLENTPSALKFLKKLKVLVLSHQRSQTFIVSLANLTSLERLYLDDLPISFLHGESFSSLPELQYLSITSSKIANLQENTFMDLPSLASLDLSGNYKWKNIYSTTFLHIPSNATVNISHNPQLNFSVRLEFNQLFTLDLSFCNLSFLPLEFLGINSMVDNLNLTYNAITSWTREEAKILCIDHKLKQLDLSYNKIAFLSQEMGTQYLGNLILFDIGGNPIDCNTCELNDFQTFIKEKEHIVRNVGTNNSLKCVYPNWLEGTEVLIATHVCYSNWIKVGIPVFISVMIIISLIIFGYAYRFELVYTKHMWHMKRKNATRSIKRNVQCEFDAFVSYCADDRSWVLEQLLVALEPPGDNYALCLHERDFRLGTFIMDNIVENIEKSRRVLFVLSNNFLKSEWCKWELRLATHRIFEKSASDFLILLELERLAREQVPLSLRILMASRTYLEWNCTSAQQSSAFWSRLKRAMGAPINPVRPKSDSIVEEDDDEWLQNIENYGVDEYETSI